MEFEYDGWRFQVIQLQTLARLQLWYKQPGRVWELGHGKDIPQGMGVKRAATIMRQAITGEITNGLYNELLPA